MFYMFLLRLALYNNVIIINKNVIINEGVPENLVYGRLLEHSLTRRALLFIRSVQRVK